MNLCDPEYTARWKDIERNTIPPIQAIMCDPQLLTNWKQKVNPWLWVSLSIWSEIMKKHKLIEQCRLLRWIAYDTDFEPNKLDSTFKMWKNGPKMHWEIIQRGDVMSFQQLKELYNLGNQDFHRYLQLRHYLKQEQKSMKFYLQQINVLKIILDASKSELSRKIISKLYTALEDLKADTTEYVKGRWEREANIKILGADWEQISAYQWKTTRSWFWREYGWKTIIRFFLTPAQRKYADTKCWRSCGADKADHFHIFWGCPSIIQYWIDIKNIIDEVLNIKFPLSFEIFYLGKIEILNLRRKEDCEMMRIMILASKKAITRRWRTDLVPRVEEWVDVMLNIYNMEKVTASR
ncbi:hypothetical protein NQD34_012257 [Periophthalmus magnuspinnatus]|nr:hypothetical protein NQD34_012257 [Periophthalmus magnuspinnatus]